MGMTYSEFWKDVAGVIKINQSYVCAGCGVDCERTNKNGLQMSVHHVDGNVENNERDNLIGLCSRCHLREQGLLMRGRSKLLLDQRGQMKMF